VVGLSNQPVGAPVNADDSIDSERSFAETSAASEHVQALGRVDDLLLPRIWSRQREHQIRHGLSLPEGSEAALCK